MFYRLKTFIRHLRFLRGRPVVLYRILMGVFKVNILRKPVLRSIEFGVSGKCQLHCEKCYAQVIAKDSKRTVLSTANIKHTIRKAYSLGLIHVNWTTMEPLLRNDIIGLVKWTRINCPGVIQTLVTNGVALTACLAEHLYDAGLSMIQISVDSVNFETHDRLRGREGLWDHIYKVTKEIVNKNLGIVCWTTTITHELMEEGHSVQLDNTGYPLLNWGSELACFLFYVERWFDGKVFVLINLIGDIGGYEDNPDVRLNADELLMVRVLERVYPIARRDMQWNFTGRWECPGGREKIYITQYGDVFPCDLVTSHNDCFGNLRTRSLKEIWRSMLQDPVWGKQRSKVCKRYTEVGK